jgi:hypothetical protein
MTDVRKPDARQHRQYEDTSTDTMLHDAASHAGVTHESGQHYNVTRSYEVRTENLAIDADPKANLDTLKKGASLGYKGYKEYAELAPTIKHLTPRADYSYKPPVNPKLGIMERMALGRAMAIIGPIIDLHTFTSEGWMKPNALAAGLRSLLASDAGVVGLVQTLRYDSSFKGAMTLPRKEVVGNQGGGTKIMTALLTQDKAMAEEFQLRADKGFLEARNAVNDTLRKMAEAKTPQERAKAFCDFFDTDVGQRAAADAAYGAGVMYCFFLKARGMGAKYEEEVKAANANLDRVGPSTVHVQG